MMGCFVFVGDAGEFRVLTEDKVVCINEDCAWSILDMSII